MVYILSVSHMGFILTVITNNKKRIRQKIEEGKFHSFNKASLQQTPMFHKKNLKKKKKKKQHRNKNKIGATLGGLLLWPGLGSSSSLRKLSKKGLEILGALVEGNSLKGLDKKNWLLGMGGLSITCGLYSLLWCIRVLAFTRLSRTRRLAFLG